MPSPPWRSARRQSGSAGPYVYGLALAGASGVAEVMRNLIAELDITMGLAGVTSVADITGDSLRSA